MVKTYVISLENPVTLCQDLSAAGLETTWVPGVNGKTLSPQEISANTTPFYAIFGPRASIGCGMAHIHAWQTIVKNGDPYALIVEEDVVLEPDFTPRLRTALTAMPTDTDILAVGCFGCNSPMNLLVLGLLLYGNINIRKRHETVNDVIVKPRLSLGTHAYIVTQEGAKKLLQATQGKLYDHIDSMIQKLQTSNVIQLYALRERLAYQTSTNSGISNNTNARHPLLLTSLLSYISLDRLMNARYSWSLMIVQIMGIPITVGTLIFALVGAVLAFTRVPISYLTLFYLVLCLPDLILEDVSINIINYLFLVVPVLVLRSLLQMRAKQSRR